VVYVESRFLSGVVTQEDIRQLDFAALRQAGYRGAVFDKDNCLVGLFAVL
jgi:phosphatidylglycerophosphatase GEP4